MIKFIITMLTVFLYLYFGVSLFRSAINRIGGKEEYLRVTGGSSAMFYVALILVIFGWPVFFISAMIDNNRRNR